jgi:hypothetical protein
MHPMKLTILTTLLHRAVALFVLCGALAAPFSASAQSNLLFRVMAANLPGNPQKYEAPQIRILQGLQPDVVAIQEFNYLGSNAAEIRSFVDTAFGTNFVYYRESGYSLPNGVISRWPILSSGSWPDAVVPNRGFAWAQIDLGRCLGDCRRRHEYEHTHGIGNQHLQNLSQRFPDSHGCQRERRHKS